MIGQGSGTPGPKTSSANTSLAPRNYEMPTQPNMAYAARVTSNVYEDLDINNI